jgi:hypothetical protein
VNKPRTNEHQAMSRFPRPSSSTADRGDVSVLEVNGDVHHMSVASAADEIGAVWRRAGVRGDAVPPVVNVVGSRSHDTARHGVVGAAGAAASHSVVLRRAGSCSERLLKALMALLDDSQSANDGYDSDDPDDDADDRDDATQSDSSLLARLRRFLNAALYWAHVRVPHVERVLPRSLAARSHVLVRAIAWHPVWPLLAVATGDSVLFFNARSRSVEQVALTHELQRGVLALAWRPLDAATLAVACGSGVCLWHVEFDAPSGGAVSTAWMRNLRAHGHAPVTTLAWAPDGVLLATGSPNDSSVMLWDVDLNCKCTPLGAAAPLQGVTLVRWAPDASMLFAASTEKAFGVFRAGERWQVERWAKCAGGVLAATWLPDSSALLLACAPESATATATLTALRFARQGGAVQFTLPLPAVDAKLADGRVWRGVFEGAVCDMALNDTAERLAVTFTPKRVAPNAQVRENAASLVALFAVTTRPTLSVLPLGAARLFGASAATNACCVAFSPQSNLISRELLLRDEASVHATLLAVSGENGSIGMMPRIPHAHRHVAQTASVSAATAASAKSLRYPQQR